MNFDAGQLEELSRGHCAIRLKSDELQRRYLVRNYRNQEAKEYANQGFSRRLDTLVRCIDRVFEILPPERKDIPDGNEVIDATINIQAFVFNIFGCCENLAWTWVCEKAVTQRDGQPLEPMMIGLGKKYRDVWNSFSPCFAQYLHNRQDWFAHIKDFRDALAHRISLYIPPYFVAPAQIDEYRRLEMAANDALHNGDITGYEQLMLKQEQLRAFHPIMTHSLFQNMKIAVFHKQMLIDFNMIDEIGRKFLEELDRQ